MIAMPVEQFNHNYIDADVQHWLDIHFPADSDYQGRVFLGYRPYKKSGIFDMSRRNIGEIKDFVHQMHVSPNVDYYISANSFKGVKRSTEDLFALHNIVIDIDCHKGENISSAREKAQALVWLCSEDLWRYGGYPQPNSVVYTGRGVQFWWSIDAISVKLLWIYQKIQVWLMDGIQGIIDENEVKLKGLSIDRAASKRTAGWFRLPATHNTRAKIWGNFEILGGDRYSHQDLYDYVPAGYKSPYEQVNPNRHNTVKAAEYDYIPLAIGDIDVIKGGTSNMALRVHQLIQLRALRRAVKGDEMRDRFCFSVYCALLADYDESEAWHRLLKFNKGFTNPLPENKLAQMMSTAERKKYNLTNEKLIVLLEITAEEQQKIKMFPVEGFRVVGRGSNFTRDMIRRTAKEDRNNKIISLFVEGKAKAEIARVLGISRGTVTTVIADYENELQAENEALEAEEVSVVAAGDEENLIRKEKVFKNGAYIFVSYRDTHSPSLLFDDDSPPELPSG